MPRIARKKSSSGIYHVMLRGIDKRDIFLSKRDYQKFIDYVEKARGKSGFLVYAYCLMTNHVHLLLKTGYEEIGNIVRRIAVGYAQYHNMRNGRTGHLFQNRFRSEAVENDAYFIMVLRYIHQNPLKAGIVEAIEDYKWSSYKEYINKEKGKLVDPAFAMGFFENVESFEKYMTEENEDKCLDYNPKPRYTDEELKEAVLNYADSVERLHELNKKTRDEIIRMIKANTRASNRQLSGVLHIGRGIIERIK
jgi:REP element-mobilizing transposase RayT